MSFETETESSTTSSTKAQLSHKYKVLLLLFYAGVLIAAGLTGGSAEIVLLVAYALAVSACALQSAVYLRAGALTQGVLMLFLALAFVFIGYERSKPIIARYELYRSAQSQHGSDCDEANAHACHMLASAARNWGKKEEAGKYYTAACLLGDEEACADWNRLYTGEGELSEMIRSNITEKLCEEDNLTACVQKAELLMEQRESEEAKELLEQACEAQVPEGCGLLGKYYSSRSILRAQKLYEKACELSRGQCWREEFTCQNLVDSWRRFEEAGELDETLALCRSLCEDGSKFACWELDYFRTQRKNLHRQLGDKKKQEGDIVGAAAHYSKLCDLGMSQPECYKLEYLCGNVSLGEFRKRNPTAEKKEETLELCKAYCHKGIDTACGGVAAFYHDEEQEAESLVFLHKECGLDKEQCRSLEHRCKFYSEDLLERYPQRREEIQSICKEYRE